MEYTAKKDFGTGIKGMNSFYSEEELKCLGFKRVGENVLISKKASIYSAEKMEIGSDVRIDDFCILSGKIILGCNVHIAAYIGLFGGEKGIYIEDYVGISSGSRIYAASDDYSGEVMTNPTVDDKYKRVIQEKVLIRKNVIIGSGCVILPGITVGEGAAVGSMSLINKNIEPWSMNKGIPCKKYKDRSKKLLELQAKYEKERRLNDE